jgi:protein-L-isoaspartate(D-aspartate) O-methyltransferase
MIDLAAARRTMVDCQVRTADVTSLELLAAMLAVPRERFVPESRAALAYLDCDLAVADGAAGSLPRRLLKPMVLAKLLQAAEISDGDHVLDVGCASGYSAAVLARLAASVVALEEDPVLARWAEVTLTGLGLSNVTVVSGPLADGWPSRAPYDVIVLNGAVELLPDALGRQLRSGGRLVCVSGHAPAARAMVYRLADGKLTGRPAFDAAAPLLPGFAAPAAFAF